MPQLYYTNGTPVAYRDLVHIKHYPQNGIFTIETIEDDGGYIHLGDGSVWHVTEVEHVKLNVNTTTPVASASEATSVVEMTLSIAGAFQQAGGSASALAGMTVAQFIQSCATNGIKLTAKYVGGSGNVN